jgi:hypothetical protein
MVTLKADDTPLEEIIAMIHQEYNVRFSHGTHFQALQKRVSVSVTNVPLREFLRIALDEAGLYYKPINGALVLRQKVRVTGKPDADYKPDGSTYRTHDESILNSEYMEESRIDLPLSSDSMESDLQLDTEQDTTSMVQGKPDTVLKGSENSAGEPGTKNRKALPIYACVGYSFDVNRHDFAPPSVPFFRYYSEREWGIQAGILFHPFPRIITFAGVGYVTKSFSMEYNYEMIDNDPMAIPERTAVRVSYIEVPVQVGYEFFRHRAFSAYVTGGLYATFRIDQQELTTYQNAPPADTKTFLGSNTKFMMAGSAGLMLQQAIGKRWAVVVQPSYMWYTEPVNTEAMASGTRLLRINTTLALRLK